MNSLVLVLVTGLTMGSLYALVATGLVTVYRSTHMLNFAQADIATLTAFASWVLLRDQQNSFLAAILMSTFLGAAAGYLMSHLVAGDELTGPILTLGVGLMIYGLNGAVFGHRPLRVPKPLEAYGTSIAGVRVTAYDLVVVVTSALIIGLLFALFRYTWIGRAVRATSQNVEAAELMGVSTKLVGHVAWVLGGLLGSFSAMLAVPRITLSTDSLLSFTIVAFLAVAIGGFSSFVGAILGGLALGIGMAAYQLYLWPELQSVALVLAIVAVLTVRPSGLVKEQIHARP